MIKVGVLRGGTTDEYDVSLNTGSQVLSALSPYPDEYKVFDILVTKEGEWYMHGLPVTENKLKDSVDIVWNALHGGQGENGKTQKLLEDMGIPYTGPRSLPGYSALHKIKTKDSISQNLEGLYFPKHYILPLYEDNTDTDLVSSIYSDVVKSLPPPWVIKPAGGGSSIDTFVTKTRDELWNGISFALGQNKEMMIEEYIFGREFSCGVIDDFRGEEYYTLLPVEIKKKDHIFNFEDKYSDNNIKICPAFCTEEEKSKIMHHSKEIHKMLGMSHYSSSDFIITKDGRIFFLECDALPALYPYSSFVTSLRELGISIKDLVSHIIKKVLG